MGWRKKLMTVVGISAVILVVSRIMKTYRRTVELAESTPEQQLYVADKMGRQNPGRTRHDLDKEDKPPHKHEKSHGWLKTRVKRVTNYFFGDPLDFED